MTAHFRIHSNSCFVQGIMMFCISVVIDGSAELAHNSNDYWHLNSLGDCSKRLWLSTRLTKYWHFACRSETIFRLQSCAYFTTPVQNVNISLYLIHFIESCWELRRAGPRQWDFLQDPGNGMYCKAQATGFPAGVAIRSTSASNATSITKYWHFAVESWNRRSTGVEM